MAETEPISDARLQLERCQDRLETVSNDFEQFAYVVSHDLQEQVRNITNFAGLLEKRMQDDKDEEMKLCLGVINGSSARLNLLLSDLLTFSRIGRNKMPEPVDCTKVFAGVLSEMEETIRKNQAKITIGKMPVIMGFEGEIKLLFQNLLSNALKFRNKISTPEISFQCHNKSGVMEFSITDNGIGLAEVYSKKIFMMFQRLHPDEDYPGTGAGLALCKKIINHHGGEIWVKSKPGQGSDFYFTIPIINNRI